MDEQIHIFSNIYIKIYYVCQATKPDVLAKRDSSVEVDPYAAYYEAYSNQVQNQPLSHGLSEKQGFAGTMENVLGDDAAVSFIKCRLKILFKFIQNNNILQSSLLFMSFLNINFLAPSWNHWCSYGSTRCYWCCFE